MDLNLRLEMPLEAMVLRHPAAAAGSLWACVAVLAAIGLWRIRSAAVTSTPADVPRGVHPEQTRLRQQQQPTSAKAQPEAPEKPVNPPVCRSPGQLSVGSVRSPCIASPRKQTLFEARGCCELVVDDEDNRGSGDAVEGADDCGHLEDDRKTEQGIYTWPIMGDDAVFGDRGWVERCRGDLGWYLYQDVASLNGRVVRLWEDEKRRAASRLVRRRRW